VARRGTPTEEPSFRSTLTRAISTTARSMTCTRTTPHSQVQIGWWGFEREFQRIAASVKGIVETFEQVLA